MSTEGREVVPNLEADAWGFFFGKSVPRKVRDRRQRLFGKYKDKLGRVFKERADFVLFLEGALSEHLSGRKIELFNQLHTDAVRLLIEYADVYKPGMIDGNMWGDVEPTEGACSLNSYLTMKCLNERIPKAEHLQYVEGVTLGPFIPRAMLHAWNTWESKKLCTATLDWTLYTHTRWCKYFGIPFSEEEYDRINETLRKSNKCGLLFSKDFFNDQVERAVRSILQNRRKKRRE